MVYIGIFKNDPISEPIQLKLKIREIPHLNCVSDEIKVKAEIFDRIFEGTDASHESKVERENHALHWKIELTYGDVLFLNFIPILNFVEPKENEVFWDLGCGGGKPLVIASMCFP